MLFKKIILFFAIIAFFGLLAGCSTEKVDDRNGSIIGLDYYPLEIGTYIIYDVKESIFRYNFDSTRTDEIKTEYQLKEKVADSFIGASGETILRLERYKRPTENAEWQIDSVWSVRKNNYNVVRKENNVDFVVLTFPVRTNNSWNGNMYNSREATAGRAEDIYTITQRGIDVTINSKKLKDCVVVLQNDDSTCLNVDFRQEIFARNIGLVYKVSRIYNFFYNTNRPDLLCVAPFRIEAGRKYYQSYLSHGKE
jgi:hypothetical protein